MNALMVAALGYVSRGWPVFPCQPRGKVPVGQIVAHGLHNASVDSEVVERWWRRLPAANIGLRTGLVFDVLDVDGPIGMAALDGTPHSVTIDGPTCKTGGGGDHVYVLPTGLGNRAGLLPKVDWRGDGGYVIAPPSVHASGQIYRWLQGWGPDEQPLRPAPAWLLELLQSKATTTRPRAHIPAGGYGRRALESEVARVALAGVGTRNATLNEAAFSLGRLVAGGELDGGEVFDALLTAGNRSGLTETECVNTIRSGLSAGARQPRSAPARRAG